MEWKDILDSGVSVVAFFAFLRLVFVDMAEIKQAIHKIEEILSEQNRLYRRVLKEEMLRGDK